VKEIGHFLREVSFFLYSSAEVVFMTFRPYLALALFLASVIWAEDSRNTTVIAVTGIPPGFTAMRIDTLSQCIGNLPADSSLQASATGHDEYLKRILGGSESRNVKVWDAKITLTFQRHVKLLYVLAPQGGLEKQEPVFREVESSQMVSETIPSSPGDSDFFAFSSPRRYYFETEAKAIASARKKALIRLGELRPLLCSSK